MKHIYAKILLILFILILSGCSTVKINFELRPVKGVKVSDEYGDPVPAAIRVYQLRRDSRFNDVPVKVLFKRDRELLKGDMLDIQKVRIYQEGEASLKFKKVKDVEYIGIIAMVRKDEDTYSWKRLFAVKDKRIKEIDINLKRDTDTITLNLIPTEKMNADKRGNPLPASVRIYQLKSKERFTQADFKSLWKKDKETLAEDIIDLKKLNLYPDNKKKVSVKKTDNANYLGLVVIFRNPANDNTWKRIIDLTESFNNDINVVFNKDNIEIKHIKNTGEREKGEKGRKGE